MKNLFISKDEVDANWNRTPNSTKEYLFDKKQCCSIHGEYRCFSCAEARVLENYGCVVKIFHNVLVYAPLLQKVGIGEFDEVTAPESQEFLDQVNLLFGTNFRTGDFPGR